MKLLKFFAVLFVLSFSLYAADLFPYPQMKTHPDTANIPIEKCPMFIVFGFDDNGYADGMDTILDIFADPNHKNPQGSGNSATFDGMPIKASFFNTANFITNEGAVGTDSQSIQDVINSWQRAYNEGHEIGNHTYSHSFNLQKEASQGTWETEIEKCDSILANAIGMPKSEIYGFRTPFLGNGNATTVTASIGAAAAKGKLYDCTIEYGWNGWEGQYGTLYWPYTLDNGPSDMSATAASGVGKHPGVFEFPVYVFLENNGGQAKAAGFDYNLWKAYKMPDMSKDKFVEVLKKNLKLRMDKGAGWPYDPGNRSPFCIGMHSDYYTPDKPDTVYDEGSKTNVDVFPTTDHVDRTQGVIEFIEWALEIPEVRIVRFIDVIKWMRDPVALDMPSEANFKNVVIPQADISYLGGDMLNIYLTKSGNYSLDLFNISGQKISNLKTGYVKKGHYKMFLNEDVKGAGVYMIKLSGDATATAKIVFK